MSERLNIPRLADLVGRHFSDHAAQFGLAADRVTATCVLNWGGFVNYSFTVSDGRVSYHVKLGEPGQQERLQQWRSLHATLEDRYHAPRMVGWVEVPEAGYAGPIFDHIRGDAADFTCSPGLLADVIALAESLHRDEDLAGHLRSAYPSRTHLESFLETYIERWESDMEAVDAQPPPFVSPATRLWMHREIRRLEAVVRRMAAFASTCHSSIHGDLWAANVLVTNSGDWYIIDWDDLALGDPATDHSLLVRTQLLANPGSTWQDFLAPVPDGSAEFSARMDVHERAIWLDYVVDVLADYIEAAVWPDRAEEVRSVKQTQHEQALRVYRERYSAAG